MFYQLDWQQMEKNWKVICTASFFFIVTHYSRFCSLISASSSLATHGEKGGSCSTSAFTVCFLGIQLGGVSPRITAKEQLQLNVPSFISISMQRLEIRPPAGTTPICNLALAASGRQSAPENSFCPQKPCSPLSRSLPAESR